MRGDAEYFGSINYLQDEEYLQITEHERPEIVTEMLDSSIKFKNIFWICVIIVSFHMVMIISLSKLNLPITNDDKISEEISENVNIIDMAKYVSPQQKTYHKQNSLGDFSSYKRQSDSKLTKPNQDNYIKKNVNSNSDIHSNGLCQNGHAKDIVATCEAVGCLRKLNLPSHEKSSSVSIGNRQVSQEFHIDMQKARGKLHRIHIDIVSLLTNIQWHNGIFGSVAVLGDDSGLMTKLIAANTDIVEGENVIIVQPGTHNNLLEQYTFSDQSVRQNIYLCPGYSNFSKVYFVENDIPQFRFVSINLNENVNVLSYLIEMTACILREGGILVIDNSHTEKVTKTVQDYLAKHGNTAIKPLLATGNKIYFSSPRWKAIYTDKLLQNQSVLSLFQLSHDFLFNSACKYLSTSRA